MHHTHYVCTGVAAEVPGEHPITSADMLKESSSYVKKVAGNYAPERAGVSKYGTDLVRAVGFLCESNLYLALAQLRF